MSWYWSLCRRCGLAEPTSLLLIPTLYSPPKGAFSAPSHGTGHVDVQAHVNLKDTLLTNGGAILAVTRVVLCIF